MGEDADMVIDYYIDRNLFKHKKGRRMPKWGKRGNSKTKYHKFIGKAVYVKPYVPDEYNGRETWKCGLTVSREVWSDLRETGCQVKKRLAESVPNIDEDTAYVVFTRDVEKQFGDEKTYFCPPVIYDVDGEKVVWYGYDDDEIVRQFKEGEKQPERHGDPFLIGNGSDIEVTVAVYPAGSYGFGHRWESIRVIDLLEYEPEEKSDHKDTQSKVLKKDTEKKTEKKSSVEETKSSKKDLIASKSEALEDDEIPFEKNMEGPGW